MDGGLTFANPGTDKSQAKLLISASEPGTYDITGEVTYNTETTAVGTVTLVVVNNI